eukprot:CAMPEP_0119009288 /NCGR_PEP_ID=MMETSP1176-20130426/4263_1 /TAXON_ID=265551 /ORGANISM="Synedropsis recta cf, Strain CCMP1620" /LENGTH=224 /DNA_ID=CAMNT_0006961765 /DNA_START=217 /DNA_END=891 /DNA_ORIENTATION=-
MLHAGVTFHQIPVIVTGNPRRQELLDGQLSHNDFLHLAMGSGNESIQLQFMGGSDDCSYSIRWRDFLIECDTIHLWASIPHQRDWREALKGRRSDFGRRQLFERLCQEVKGDVSCTNALCKAFDSLAINTSKTTTKGPLPLDPLVLAMNTLPLDMTGALIQDISDSCDSIIMEALLPCYGGFISWSNSILPVGTLDAIADSTTVVVVMFGYFGETNARGGGFVT